jgi:hypothetical protein
MTQESIYAVLHSNDGYYSEHLKKSGEILAFMLTAFIIIGALPVFGLITLQVMLPMMAVLLIAFTPAILGNFQKLKDNDKNIKSLVKATKDVLTL